MKHIFFIGHGVAANDMELINIPRFNTVTFYCEEGQMLDADEVPIIVNNPFHDDIEYREIHGSGAVISEHILCTTMDTWNGLGHLHTPFRRVIVHWNREVFNLRCCNYVNAQGVIDEDKILIDAVEHNTTGFKLSFLMNVVEQLGLDRGGEYTFHWTACRSLAYGDNQVEIIKDLANNGLFTIEHLVPSGQEIDYANEARLGV